MERARNAIVEAAPGLEMLEHHPRTTVIFVAQCAIQKILIERRHDESTRREVLAEILISRIGEILHVVVPVHDEHEREGSRPIAIPHSAVDRKLLRVEAPSTLAFAR